MNNKVRIFGLPRNNLEMDPCHPGLFGHNSPECWGKPIYLQHLAIKLCKTRYTIPCPWCGDTIGDIKMVKIDEIRIINYEDIAPDLTSDKVQH